MTDSAPRRATLEDFWAIPEAERYHELIAGAITPKAAPSGEHGDAQAGIVGAIRPPFQRSPGRGGPGGWSIATEVEVLLDGADIARPDVLGWRREHCPELRAERGEIVRPEPFPEIELAVGTLFGDDPPER
jgi:Uma2 family endonuclease